MSSLGCDIYRPLPSAGLSLCSALVWGANVSVCLCFQGSCCFFFTQPRLIHLHYTYLQSRFLSQAVHQYPPYVCTLYPSSVDHSQACLSALSSSVDLFPPSLLSVAPLSCLQLSFSRPCKTRSVPFLSCPSRFLCRVSVLRLPFYVRRTWASRVSCSLTSPPLPSSPLWLRRRGGGSGGGDRASHLIDFIRGHPAPGDLAWRHTTP